MKKEILTRKELYDLVWSEYISTVAKRYNVSLGFCPLDLQSEYLIENDIVGMRYLKGEIHNFYFVYY